MPVECETCGGSGRRAGHAPGTLHDVRRARARCARCAARCSVSSSRPRRARRAPEPARYCPNPCETCRGDGRVHGTRTLDVDVPAGIDDGQRLRLAQRGPAAPRGGVPGDLYVNVRVRARSRRSCATATISSTARRCRSCRPRSARSSRSRRSTASSRSRSRPGTQHGAQIRLRGLGVPSLRNGRRGDLVCEIAVEVPRNLTEEEAELLAQFAALRGEDVESAARRPVLAHPLRVPVARPGDDRDLSGARSWCAAEDAVAHVFVDALDDDVTVDGADGHHLQRVRRRVARARRDRGRRHRSVAPLRRAIASAPARLELAGGAAGARRTRARARRSASRSRSRRAGIDHVVGPRAPSSASTASSRCARGAASCAGTTAGPRPRSPGCATIVARGRGAEPPGPAPRGRAGRRPRRRSSGRPGLVIADRAGIAGARLAGARARRAGPSLVGPEGGFDPAELAPFPDPVPRLAVGPHVLRAETAPSPSWRRCVVAPMAIRVTRGTRPLCSS